MKQTVLTRTQSCEKIRVSLEDCEVDKDIAYFIKEKGTGSDIPDPPKFVDFARSDDEDDSASESSEEGYAESQYQRTINTTHRKASPQPSTYESHHDPHSELAKRMGRGDQSAGPQDAHHSIPRKQPNSPFNGRCAGQGIDVRSILPSSAPSSNRQQENGMATQQPPQLDSRRGGQLPPNYDPNQHGEIASVPYNAYPADGMTMFCRPGPPSERSSAVSGYRPSSRSSQSDISNPTSVSSQEPAGTKQSPTKSTDNAASGGRAENQVQKKRSGFFSNSPFHRSKSRHEKDRPNTTASQFGSPVAAPCSRRSNFDGDAASEAADPRANFQLNVGNNVFDVASPDASPMKKAQQSVQGTNEDVDPIARALADLKGGSGKQSSSRVSADRYHGIATPAPTAAAMNFNGATTATPPPAYNDSSVRRLDAPQPAFTASQMQKRTQKYVGQAQNVFNGNGGVKSSVGAGQDIARSRSPFARRSASPQVYSPRAVSPRVSNARAVSPHVAGSHGGSPHVSPVAERRMSQSPYQSNSTASGDGQSPTAGTSPQGYPPYAYSRMSSPGNGSPQPQFRQQSRPSSTGLVERQMSNHPGSYGAGYDGFRGPTNGGNVPTFYPDVANQGGRSRSRTLAIADPGKQFSRDGRPILHFGKFDALFPLRLAFRLTRTLARAMYSYTAAIPEELGFSKGDTLAIIRLQDDGWWEAEVVGTRNHPGLVPSNYLQVL